MSEHRDIDESAQQHWLKTYRVSGALVALTTVFYGVIFVVLSLMKVGDFLDAKIADPIQFKTRDLLGKGPDQDPRLKIYAIDDQTFASLGTPMPSLELWGDLLDSITAKRPKAVIIDAMFSAKSSDMTPKAKKLFEIVKASGVPIVTGSFVSEREVRFKDTLDLSPPVYSVGTYLRGAQRSAWSGSHMPGFKDRSRWFAYGPHGGLRTYFSNVGHFQLFEENRIEPFLSVGNNKIIPHAAMWAADEITFTDEALMINGNHVALDRSGAVPVNFLQRSKTRVYSLEPLIRRAQQGYAADHVKEGDVVLILPLFFTGNVDLRPSPYGWIPGGLYMAAMINSALTGHWIQPVLMSETLVIALIAIAASMAYFITGGLFWRAWAGVMLAFFAVTQILFSYTGLVIPWVLPLMAANLAGAHVFALKVRSSERKGIALRAALDGAVSPAQLEALIAKTDTDVFEPRERVVTLMFIDVVGFSISSENMLPRLAFDNLKNILAGLTQVIHAHGGVVDKTLGDGLLCYFGYKIESDETEADHPERAVRCACEIQRKFLGLNTEAARTGAPLYPLRIGINTTSCYVGDIGSGRRIEFTVVGNGVNFAKRLEAACETYRIMMGSTTHDLVKGLTFDGGDFDRKVIKVKHHEELMDAWELNPLAGRGDEIAIVEEAYYRGARSQRISERLQIRENDRVKVSSEHGDGRLIDFSGTGVSVSMSGALNRGTELTLWFESREPGLAAKLAEGGVDRISGEVRWSYLSAQGVVHGIMFKNLTQEQAEYFSKTLSEFAFMSNASVAKAAGEVHVKKAV